MKNLIKKVRSKRGESFVELLIAVLIVAFGCLIIATMYSSAFNMNISAEKNDDAFYAALEDMENMKGGEEFKAYLTDDDGDKVEVTVNGYGDDVQAYREK